MSIADNPAWCPHERTGIVTNQDPDQPYDKTQPFASVAVCSQEKCLAKAIKKVAGQTNRQAVYYDDAERRAKKVEV